MMTYKELLQQLQTLNEEQLNSDVAVYDEGTDEYYQLKVELVFTTDECDVLDANHPVIRFWWQIELNLSGFCMKNVKKMLIFLDTSSVTMFGLWVIANSMNLRTLLWTILVMIDDKLWSLNWCH